MKILFAATFCALIALPAFAEDKPADKDYVVLRVGNEDIKKSEIANTWKAVFPGENAPAFDSLDSKLKENIYRNIAGERIMLSEAYKSGVQNSETVKERIKQVDRQIVIEEFLRDKTQSALSDDALHAVYNDYVKSVGSGKEEIKARHILVKEKASADAIEKKLKKGGDFSKIAKEESQDEASGASGGELGWFAADRMTPEFSKAAFSLKKGEISAPVKTEFGWHIIQVEDRRKVVAPTFEQMKPELKREAAAAAVRAYMEEMMKNVKITVVDAEGHETLLPPPAAPKLAAAPVSSGDKVNSDKK